MKTFIPIVMALVVVGACDDDDDVTPIGADGEIVAFAADIAAYPPFDYISGSADVTTVIGASSFAATVSIFDDQPGSVRPWLVRVGTCANSFDRVGDRDNYPDLVVDAAGTDTVAVVLPHELDPNELHHIQFYLSPDHEDHDTDVLACGDLVLQ